MDSRENGTSEMVDVNCNILFQRNLLQKKRNEVVTGEEVRPRDISIAAASLLFVTEVTHICRLLGIMS